MKNLKKLKELYDKGINISSFLRDSDSKDFNTPEIIEVAYDLQAGTYYNEMISNKEVRTRKIARAQEIASHISNLCPDLKSLLKAGVGEASTLLGMLDVFDHSCKVFGFDISWSRTAYARKLISETWPGQDRASLCTGELEHLPFADSSINVVHTSHAIEPNGGREKEILLELYRACSEYLVLVEPAYEFANQTQQARMMKHGYCTNLISHIRELGLELVDTKILSDSMNPDNPSMMLTIRKKGGKANPPQFCCPESHGELTQVEQFMYSKQSMLAYPVLQGIPCLRSSNSIIATKLMDFYLK